MSLIPWKQRNTNPIIFRDLESLTDDFNKLFTLSFPRWFEGFGSKGEGSWIPALDLVNEKNEIRVRAEVPGLDKKDLHVSVDDDILTIEGEKKNDLESKENGHMKTERYYGSFSRSISLPSGVDSRNAKASYKNGVLELKFPKREEVQPKQIDVEVE